MNKHKCESKLSHYFKHHPKVEMCSLDSHERTHYTGLKITVFKILFFISIIWPIFRHGCIISLRYTKLDRSYLQPLRKSESI